jgi:hypothetical protein
MGDEDTPGCAVPRLKVHLRLPGLDVVEKALTPVRCTFPPKQGQGESASALVPDPVNSELSSFPSKATAARIELIKNILASINTTVSILNFIVDHLQRHNGLVFNPANIQKFSDSHYPMSEKNNIL